MGPMTRSDSSFRPPCRRRAVIRHLDTYVLEQLEGIMETPETVDFGRTDRRILRPHPSGTAAFGLGGTSHHWATPLASRGHTVKPTADSHHAASVRGTAPDRPGDAASLGGNRGAFSGTWTHHHRDQCARLQRGGGCRAASGISVSLGRWWPSRSPGRATQRSHCCVTSRF
jgi:hypothetical protein